MSALSSPLVEHARVKGVFVRSTADWDKLGAVMWAEMSEALLHVPPARRVMGIDSEWFNKNPLAVVQIATATHCFVVHLSYLDNRVLPDPIKVAFADERIIKCGVGIHGDVKRLHTEQGFTMNSVMDLEKYSILYDLTKIGETNLRSLTYNACHVLMTKDKYITRSNWELPLTKNQIAYAADDAVASFLVGDAIMAEAVKRNGTSELNVPQWLRRTDAPAAAVFRGAMRSHTAAVQQVQAYNAANAAGNGASGAGERKSKLQSVLPTHTTARVQVLGVSGAFLFECSQNRAKYYTEEREIAKVTKWRTDCPHKPAEIQLLFENQTKTRLCMYHAVGQCELGENCPFAHGLDELTPESRALADNPEVPSCAFCLNTRSLVRHAIVPPSFRRHLPKPTRWPVDIDDYVPICVQCNTLLRHFYDYEMQNVYEAAEEADRQGKIRIDLVAKCVSYARLLTNGAALAKVPLERQRSLCEYVLTNWTATRMYERGQGHHVSHAPGDEGASSHPNTYSGSSTGTSQEAPGRAPPTRTDGVSVAEAATTATADAKALKDDFASDWESLEDDDVESAEASAAAERDGQQGDKGRAEKSVFVDKNGTRVPVLDGNGNVSMDFLERLSKLVPGDVRARLTMEVLVGKDKSKATAFVERWKKFCTDTCGMIAKESNHMTNEEWKKYAEESGAHAAASRPAKGAAFTAPPPPAYHSP